MIKTFVLDTDILNDRELFDQYRSVMPEDRKCKVDRCAFQSNKNLTLGAGIVMGQALNNAISERNMKQGRIPFSDIGIRYGEKGKPYFLEYPDLFFNLSHSGHYAVCSIGGCEVGVDIEGGHDADLKIAKRFFTPEEYDWIDSVPGEAEKSRRFFRMWSLKESFLKVTGMGLSMGLDSFSFTFGDACGGLDCARVKYKDCGDKYHFMEYLLGDYSISVSGMEKDIQDELIFVDLSEYD